MVQKTHVMIEQIIIKCLTQDVICLYEKAIETEAAAVIISNKIGKCAMEFQTSTILK